jgi:WD40 repeat protein
VPGGFWTGTNAIVVAGTVTEIDIATGEQRQLPLGEGPASDAGANLESPPSAVNLAVSTHSLTGAALAENGNETRLLLWSNATVFAVDLSSAYPSVMWGRAEAIDGAIVTEVGARAVVWRGNRLWVWNLATAGDERALEGHTGPIVACALADANRVWSASLDGSVRLWDISTGAELRRFEGHSGRLLGWYLTPEIGLSWSDDNAVRLWDLSRADAGPSPSDAARVEGPGTITAVASEGRDPGQSTARLTNVVLGTSDGRLISFSPRQQPRDTRIHSHAVRSIAYLPAARAFATASDDGTVRMSRSGEVVTGAVFYSSAPVVHLQPAGDALLALDEQGHVFILDYARMSPT